MSKTFEQRREELAAYVWGEEVTRFPRRRRRRLKKRLRYVVRKIREEKAREY